jgi:sugar phosphate isomerase/epimerase
MRIVNAFRRSAVYPDPGREAELPVEEARSAFLRKVKEIGFEGIELSVPRGGETEARELRRELEDAGLPCAAAPRCVRRRWAATGSGWRRPFARP